MTSYSALFGIARFDYSRFDIVWKEESDYILFIDKQKNNDVFIDKQKELNIFIDKQKEFEVEL